MKKEKERRIPFKGKKRNRDESEQSKNTPKKQKIDIEYNADNEDISLPLVAGAEKITCRLVGYFLKNAKRKQFEPTISKFNNNSIRNDWRKSLKEFYAKHHNQSNVETPVILRYLLKTHSKLPNALFEVNNDIIHFTARGEVVFQEPPEEVNTPTFEQEANFHIFPSTPPKVNTPTFEQAPPEEVNTTTFEQEHPAVNTPTFGQESPEEVNTPTFEQAHPAVNTPTVEQEHPTVHTPTFGQEPLTSAQQHPPSLEEIIAFIDQVFADTKKRIIEFVTRGKPQHQRVHLNLEEDDPEDEPLDTDTAISDEEARRIWQEQLEEEEGMKRKIEVEERVKEMLEEEERIRKLMEEEERMNRRMEEEERIKELEERIKKLVEEEERMKRKMEEEERRKELEERELKRKEKEEAEKLRIQQEIEEKERNRKQEEKVRFGRAKAQLEKIYRYLSRFYDYCFADVKDPAVIFGLYGLHRNNKWSTWKKRNDLKMRISKKKKKMNLTMHSDKVAEFQKVEFAALLRGNGHNSFEDFKADTEEAIKTVNSCFDEIFPNEQDLED